ALAAGLGDAQLGDLLGDAAQVEGDELAVAGAGEGQVALGEARQAAELGDVDVPQRPLLGVERDEWVDDLGGAGERVQGVFDLVGEAGDDLAEGREATGADELAGQALLVGEGPLELAATAALAVG